MTKAARRPLCLLLVLIFFVALAISAGAEDPPVIMVLPFKNSTEDAAHNWLSLGLQDAITVDLWNVRSMRALAITQYLGSSGRNVYALSLSSDDEALALGKRLGVSQIWRGEFGNITPSELNIELRGIDVNTGAQLFRKEVTMPLSRVLTEVSSLVIDVLIPSGISISEEEKKLIMTVKTHSLKAFELNARGYGVQQEIANKRQKERVYFYKGWTEALLGAVKEDPGYAEAWTNLGWAYHTTGDYENARLSFKKALEVKPHLIDANMGMGYVLRDWKQDYAGASEYMKKAAEANPGLQWTKQELETTLSHVRSPEGSVALLKEAGSDRLREIKRLGGKGDVSVLPLLGELTGDTDKEVRYAAIDAIKLIGGEEALPYLSDAMKNTEKKWEIVTAIAAIREEAALPYLAEMLRTGEQSEKAAELIGEKKIKGLFPVMEEVLYKSGAPDPAIVRAFGELGDARAVPVLRKVLYRPEALARREAVLSLALLNAREALDDIRSIEKSLKKGYDKAAFLVAEAALGDKEAGAAIRNILSAKNRKLVSFTKKTMARMGPRLTGAGLESSP